MIIASVTAGIAVIAESIESVRTVVGAIRDGREHLRAAPQAAHDLTALVEEMRKTVSLVVEASCVLTRFRFAIGGNDPVAEVRLFNAKYEEQARHEQRLRDQVEELRTHCSKIREHADNAMAKISVSGFGALFNKLGITDSVRQGELATMLDRLAFDDFAVARAWASALEVVRVSMKHVQDTLCENDLLDPRKVPEAAALLGEYRAVFEPIEHEARRAQDSIKQAISELRQL